MWMWYTISYNRRNIRRLWKYIFQNKILSKYDFNWYVDRVLPIIQKFIEAKKGNVDIEYFKNIVQDNEITGPSGIGREYYQVSGIKGWILNFFDYYKSNKIFEAKQIKIKKFWKFI